MSLVNQGELVPTAASEDPLPANGNIRYANEPVATSSESNSPLIVLMAHIDIPSVRALSYAVSSREPVLALHVSPEESEADAFQRAWECWDAQSLSRSSSSPSYGYPLVAPTPP